MAIYDAFFGSDQSLYTAYAIMAAIIAICVTILLTATDISVGNRILIVLFVIVTLIPSIFLTLFEITCMVTGGTEPNRWWCYAFAWILAAFIIIYCVFVVIISLISLFTYNNAIDNVNEAEKKSKLSDIESNHIAKQIIHTEEENKKLENFYNAPQSNEQFKGNDRPTISNATAGSKYHSCPINTTWDPHSNKCVPIVKITKFENRENFGAEPLDQLQPAPVPIPTPTPSIKSPFTNYINEGFEAFDGNTKSHFSDLSLTGANNLFNNLKDNITNNFNSSFASII